MECIAIRETTAECATEMNARGDDGSLTHSQTDSEWRSMRGVS